MEQIDLNETVELWTVNPDNDDPPTAGVTWGSRVATLPLWEAVKTVMEKWAPTSRRRQSAQIIRETKPTFLDLPSIEALYERPDFPGKS